MTLHESIFFLYIFHLFSKKRVGKTHREDGDPRIDTSLLRLSTSNAEKVKRSQRRPSSTDRDILPLKSDENQSLIHKVTPQDLLLEEIRLILLRLTGNFPARLLHRCDGSGTLVVTIGTMWGDGAAEGRGTPSTRAEGL